MLRRVIKGLYFLINYFGYQVRFGNSAASFLLKSHVHVTQSSRPVCPVPFQSSCTQTHTHTQCKQRHFSDFSRCRLCSSSGRSDHRSEWQGFAPPPPLGYLYSNSIGLWTHQNGKYVINQYTNNFNHDKTQEWIQLFFFRSNAKWFYFHNFFIFIQSALRVC